MNKIVGIWNRLWMICLKLLGVNPLNVRSEGSCLIFETSILGAVCNITLVLIVSYTNYYYIHFIYWMLRETEGRPLKEVSVVTFNVLSKCCLSIVIGLVYACAQKPLCRAMAQQQQLEKLTATVADSIDHRAPSKRVGWMFLFSSSIGVMCIAMTVMRFGGHRHRLLTTVCCSLPIHLINAMLYQYAGMIKTILGALKIANLNLERLKKDSCNSKSPWNYVKRIVVQSSVDHRLLTEMQLMRITQTRKLYLESMNLSEHMSDFFSPILLPTIAVLCFGSTLFTYRMIRLITVETDITIFMYCLFNFLLYLIPFFIVADMASEAVSKVYATVAVLD
ncbi:hypothetical protein TKK_0004079 [Trichogramma kaykai]